MTTPVFEARRCTRIGSVEGRGGGPAGRTAAQVPGLVGVSGFGPGAQQFAGLEVEEHQRVRLDPDPDLAAGEDLRGQHHVPAQGHRAGAGDDPFDLDRRRPGSTAGSGGGPAG